MAVLVMVTADKTIEPGTSTDMAVWMPNRAENAIHAMSVSFLARTGLVV